MKKILFSLAVVIAALLAPQSASAYSEEVKMLVDAVNSEIAASGDQSIKADYDGKNFIIIMNNLFAPEEFEIVKENSDSPELRQLIYEGVAEEWDETMAEIIDFLKENNTGLYFRILNGGESLDFPIDLNTLGK